MIKLAALSLFASCAVSSRFQSTAAETYNTPTSYDGYHIYKITPSSIQEARDLEKRFERYHVHPVRETLSVAVPSEEVASFNALGLNARLVNADLGKYIRDTDQAPTYKRNLHKRSRRGLPDLSWFDTYHNYTDHLDFWDDLVHVFPNNSKKFTIGKSFEGRNIEAFWLFGGQKKGHVPEIDKPEKPVILWHATVHAREWISTMVRLNLDDST
jgi:hypothetical protein